MTDRKVILAVVGFLGSYAIASLATVGILVALLNKRGDLTATHIAVLGLVGQPMSAAVGLLGGILASTASSRVEKPEDGAGMIVATSPQIDGSTTVAAFGPDPAFANPPAEQDQQPATAAGAAAAPPPWPSDAVPYQAAAERVARPPTY